MGNTRFRPEPLLENGQLIDQCGGLTCPMGLAFDGDLLYIADAGNHRIVRASVSGGAELCFGVPGWGRSLDQLMRPAAVAVREGQLYIVDSGNCRILRAGLGVAKAEVYFGSRGQGPHQLLDPYDLAFDGEGNLYVADFGNHRVLRVRKKDQGTAADVVLGGAGRGAGRGQLAGPAALAFCGRDLFVADFWNHRVLRLPAGGAEAEVYFGGNGRGSGLDQLHGPRSLAFDGGALYVADWGNNRVLRMWPRRTEEAEELAAGLLEQPTGLAAAAQGGRMGAADSGGHRLLAVAG